MSVPRSVAEVLADHVTLEVEGIDRMYLNVYVPGLQRAQGVVNFFRFHRGNQFASSALMDPISKDFVAALEKYARQEKFLLFSSAKGSVRTTSQRNRGRSSGRPKVWFSSAKLRRRRQCSAPNAGATSGPASA